MKTQLRNMHDILDKKITDVKITGGILILFFDDEYAYFHGYDYHGDDEIEFIRPDAYVDNYLEPRELLRLNIIMEHYKMAT